MLGTTTCPVEGTIGDDGVQRDYAHDDKRNVTFSSYTDGTFEAYAYNDRQQVTRHRDRMGNVTRYTYNSENRLTQTEVGLTDSNPTSNDPYGSPNYDRYPNSDNATPEYAATQNEYYASGNGAGKLSRQIDARGKETDFQYDAQHRVSLRWGELKVSGTFLRIATQIVAKTRAILVPITPRSAACETTSALCR